MAATDQGAMPLGSPIRTDVLVIGSGAGGAITAATLAEYGYDVLVLEEGPDTDTHQVATNSPAAISALYRNGGLTPILGNRNIAYVEGRCVGGSTEINSAFWHRLPEHCYHRWASDALLQEFAPETIEPYFERIEAALSVSYLNVAERPRSSELFRTGIEQLRWRYEEVPRCQRADTSASPFAPGTKQSMQRTYLPRAFSAGARLLANCQVVKLLHDRGRVHGVTAVLRHGGGAASVEVRADTIFVCGGAVQTPALLRRSGIKKNVGNNLCIHPMIKAAALFDEDISAHTATLPVYQVKEFAPTITLGGAVFSPGFLAMLLADNWTTQGLAMAHWRQMGLYYAATRGMSRGVVRALPGSAHGVVVRYKLSEADQCNLSTGLARLGEVLFAAGARAVYPGLEASPIFKSVDQCRALLTHPAPIASLALSTVHAFSSCPMGENPDLCAADSFGRVRGFDNLHINDASLIPDSPGVNPQGTTMAIALRNSEHFIASREARRGRVRSLRMSAAGSQPPIIITGAPGWLGTRLVELLSAGSPLLAVGPAWARGRSIRCLVEPGVDTAPLSLLSEAVEVVSGELTVPPSLSDLFRDAAGATVFHIAGVVHPGRRTQALDQVNAIGTRNLLEAADAAGVRRVVAVSSNSPFGCNPHPDHVFDESSPYNPYMAYGRSKMRMELEVRAAQERGRIETVILRPPWFYGPHQPVRQTLFFTMIKTGRFPVLGDGSQKRSMAYVDNICDALLLAATVERAAGQAYWIADARPYSITEIVETVESVLEKDFGIACAHRQLRLPSRLGDAAERGDAWLQSMGWYNQKLHVLGEMNKTIACSIEKAQRELGYMPRYALREGMAASIAWCLANSQRI